MIESETHSPVKTIYTLAPLVALAVFGGAYWQHTGEREARLAAQHARDEAARQQKLRETRDARTKAQADATAARDARARELAEKTRRDDQQKAARLAEEQRGQAAATRAVKLRTQLEHLRAECDRAEAGVARAEERQRELGNEERFLADCVRRAEENRAAYLELCEKVETAERIRPPAPATAPRRPAPRENG